MLENILYFYLTNRSTIKYFYWTWFALMCVPWHAVGVFCCLCWVRGFPESQGWWKPARWWDWPLPHKTRWRTLTVPVEPRKCPGTERQLYSDAASRGEQMWSRWRMLYLRGGEAAQSVPLLGQPFDHRQGRRHISQQGVRQKTIGCHLHLCWHHWERTGTGWKLCILGRKSGFNGAPVYLTEKGHHWSPWRCPRPS